MYNEWSWHMNKLLQNDISFYLKVQMVQSKMNLYFSSPIYSLILRKMQKIKTDHQNKKIPNNRPYLQTQGWVTANKHILKSSLNCKF